MGFDVGVPNAMSGNPLRALGITNENKNERRTINNAMLDCELTLSRLLLLSEPVRPVTSVCSESSLK